MNPERSHARRVENAQGHISVLRKHLERGALDDGLVFDAVCIRLAAAIEEISVIPEPTLRTVFADDWDAIKATRNAIAHGYEYVDPTIVVDTVSKDLTRFESGLKELSGIVG